MTSLEEALSRVSTDDLIKHLIDRLVESNAYVCNEGDCIALQEVILFAQDNR